jgi:hypothetical protein
MIIGTPGPVVNGLAAILYGKQVNGCSPHPVIALR